VTALVHPAEEELSFDQTAIRGRPIPACRLDVVATNAATIFIGLPKRCLALRMALLDRPAIPARCFVSVLRPTEPLGIVLGEQELSRGIALFR
jgi:hypothetical protein